MQRNYHKDILNNITLHLMKMNSGPISFFIYDKPKLVSEKVDVFYCE